MRSIRAFFIQVLLNLDKRTQLCALFLPARQFGILNQHLKYAFKEGSRIFSNNWSYWCERQQRSSCHINLIDSTKSHLDFGRFKVRAIADSIFYFVTHVG